MISGSAEGRTRPKPCGGFGCQVSGAADEWFVRDDSVSGCCPAREANVESQVFDALYCTNGGRMHDRGPISRQQTANSNASGREPWAIRNELSKRNRRSDF